MNRTLAWRVFEDIMDWDESRRLREFEWLELMAQFKYDGYRDFVAGLRFVESLADWLQQFHRAERETAYSFIKSKLIYFGPGEINHLVELCYHEQVKPRLLQHVAKIRGIAPYLIWSDHNAAKLYSTVLRQSLFFGLSDGARIDAFRRTNSPLINNDQVLLATEISDEKWADVLGSLRESLKDKAARFQFAFLLDDFVATGTTLLRFHEGKWKGRLPRFWGSLPTNRIDYFASDFVVHVHHYVAAASAMQKVEARNAEIGQSRGNDWFPRIEFSAGNVLPEEIKITETNAGSFAQLIDVYYNKQIETGSTRVGGTDDIKYGYGYCGLPLVLEHNTPNDSLPIIWAETSDANGQHAMRPLFRRRERHSS
jgi:hypothetical protein